MTLYYIDEYMHRNWQLYIQEYVEELFSGGILQVSPPYMYTCSIFAATHTSVVGNRLLEIVPEPLEEQLVRSTI